MWVIKYWKYFSYFSIFVIHFVLAVFSSFVSYFVFIDSELSEIITIVDVLPMVKNILAASENPHFYLLTVLVCIINMPFYLIHLLCAFDRSRLYQQNGVMKKNSLGDLIYIFLLLFGWNCGFLFHWYVELNEPSFDMYNSKFLFIFLHVFTLYLMVAVNVSCIKKFYKKEIKTRLSQS